MSFDIARAVAETFGSRTPFLDRILSYLFFADIAVIEQSTADSWGSGVTIIGLKGEAEPGYGVVLAGALPTLRVFPSSPSFPEGSGHPRDLHRVVDLLARVFALSVLDPGTLGARLALVAYRPDPVAEALRDLPDSPLLSGMDFILSSPVGLEPAPMSFRRAVVEAHLSGGPRRPSRQRIRNVLSVSSGTNRHDDTFPRRALKALSDLAARGQAEVLDLEPSDGSDLLAPSRMNAVLGVIREPLEVPDPWRPIEDLRPTVRLGTWTDAIHAILEMARVIEDEVSTAWKGAVPLASSIPVRLVALRGSSDDCSVFFAVDLPHDDQVEVLRTRLQAQATSLCTSTLDVAIRSVHRSGPVPSGGRRVFRMGPPEDQVLQDPATAARQAANAYIEFVSRLIRER